MHISVCDYLLDLVQNAIEADSMRTTVELDETESELVIKITDTGKGMTSQELKRAKDPFYTDGVKHPGRTVGLGIPFVIQAAESTGGTFFMESLKGKGTVVRFSFSKVHVDMPPMGNLVSTFRGVLSFDGMYELEILRSLTVGDSKQSYRVSRMELADALGNLSDLQSQLLLQDYLESQEAAILELQQSA